MHHEKKRDYGGEMDRQDKRAWGNGPCQGKHFQWEGERTEKRTVVDGGDCFAETEPHQGHEKAAGMTDTARTVDGTTARRLE
jgi:hypothetical protein